jgi:4-hydroxy-3-methylbut-2-enyl diphosphate reductase
MRQNSLQEFENCEIVIVVGSKNSANSRRLCEKICKENKLCYLIESISDVDFLDEKSFVYAGNVGLTSAASAPKSLVENVKNKICEKFCLKLKKF